MTPEGRAEHIFEVTIWQYLEHDLPYEAPSKIKDHIATEIRAAVAEMEHAFAESRAVIEVQITDMPLFKKLLHEALADQQRLLDAFINTKEGL